jgi:hypothetical protein
VDPFGNKTTSARIGGIVYWICFLLALFGVISAVMWIATGEPDERWEAAARWFAFAVVALIAGRIVRGALEKRRRNGAARTE